MKTFRRVSLMTPVPDVEIDFGAAKNRLPHLVDPGSRNVRIEAAKVVGKNHNVSVVIELVDIETDTRIDGRALWVEGPNGGLHVRRSA